MILCLGTSLQILNKYPFLWAAERPKKDQPKLVIVNLQWTPKDRNATLKINGPVSPTPSPHCSTLPTWLSWEGAATM